MKLEEMKRVGEARGLEVKDGVLCLTRLLSGHYNQADADFIAMAANNWDKLMAVVEAAQSVNGRNCYPFLHAALEALEKE